MKLATSNLGSFIKSYAIYERCIYLWLFYLTYYLEGTDGSLSTAEEIENHLELGRQLLARQQYNDALSHYHAAVDLDPKNYLTYFRRATVYLALGRPKAALEDLSQVIELKPDFLIARVQRGTILLKQGNLDDAHIDFESVLRIDPYHEEVLRLYNAIEPMKHDIQSAEELMEDHDYAAAIDIITRLLHELPWDVRLRELRSQCYERLGDIIHAISDLRGITKLRTDDTQGYEKVSKLYYQIGETEESLNSIRDCLKVDPDHKECFDHYKKVKKLARQLNDIERNVQQQQYDECVDRTLSALKIEKSTTRIIQMIKAKQCHCLNKANKSKEAVKACTSALEYDPHDLNVLCDRAEAHLQDDDFENAESDYQKAHNMDKHFGRAAEGLDRVKKLIAQSQRRDYYKILGVRRNANKREVTKAYRKLAQKWHPDLFSGEEKKVAEKKFIDIAAAKEVLTDPEKREKFDRGEDPLDPESQSNHQHPFWGGHGFPFGNEQFTFKFHFG